MGNNLFAYLQQLELLAFFSGYPLLYLIIIIFAEKKESGNNFKKRIVSVLPLSYALVGTLFLGLQLKNFYLSYSSGNIGLAIHHPFLMIWGLLAILFWIRLFRKKEWFSLFHSLVFFLILVKDIFLQIGTSVDENILRNDMRIYTASLLLNSSAFILMAILYFFFLQNKKKRFRHS